MLQIIVFFWLLIFQFIEPMSQSSNIGAPLNVLNSLLDCIFPEGWDDNFFLWSS